MLFKNKRKSIKSEKTLNLHVVCNITRTNFQNKIVNLIISNINYIFWNERLVVEKLLLNKQTNRLKLFKLMKE